MTNADLIAKLQRLPPDAQVQIEDADTDWMLALHEPELRDGVIVIKGDYHNVENPRPAHL